MIEGDGFALNDWPSTTKFVPYVGDRYWESFRMERRLLIVGESHYDPNEYSEKFNPSDKEYREYTRDVVKENIVIEMSGEPNLGRFWGPLSRMLTGDNLPSSQAVCEVWSRVAYMNYIQCFVGKEGQSPKTPAMWATGEPALKDAIRILRPDRALILGWENWRHIKLGVDSGHVLNAGCGPRPERSLWQIPLSNNAATSVYATWIYHPSARHANRDPIEAMGAVLDKLITFEPQPAG